jgi:NitT/TauT family transport system permease protein
MTSQVESASAAVESRREPARARRSVSGAWAKGLDLVYPFAAVIVIITAWELYFVITGNVSLVLPKPSDVAVGLFTESDFLLGQAWVTLQEIIYGFAGAVVVSTLLAMGIVAWRPFERTVYPLIVASQVVPKVAIAPILLVGLGFGMLPKVLIVVTIAFFPLVINFVAGFKAVHTEMIYLARSMGASRLQLFRTIMFPSALPAMFTGFKVAATLSVIGAVVAEFLGASEGLGQTLLLASGNLDNVLLFAAVTYLTVIGLTIFGLIVLLERLMIPWHVSVRRTTLEQMN